MNQEKSMRRREFLAAGIALGCGLPSAVARGDVSSSIRNGFRGKRVADYDVNRAGVGRFSKFIVARKLLPRLEKFVGKQVEIDIVDVQFNFTEGPFVLREFASVAEVPQATTPLRMWARPSVEDPAAIDVFCTVTKPANCVDADGCPRISMRWAGHGGGNFKFSEHDDYGSGYTPRALNFGGENREPMHLIATPLAGSTTHGGVRVRAGETITHVFNKLPAAKGEFEATACAWFETKDGKTVVGQGRLSVDVPLAAPSADDKRNKLRIEAVVRQGGQGPVFAGRLCADGAAPRALYLRRGAKNSIPIGGLRVVDADGREIGCGHDWTAMEAKSEFQVAEQFERTELDRGGVPFQFRIGGYDLPGARRLEAMVLTEDGFEVVTIADKGAVP
jgi:hypothetical protein